MDIPSNLCENISYDELDNKKKYGMIFTNLIINWMLLNALSVLDFIGKLKNIYFKIKYLLKIYFIKIIILKMVRVI